MWRYVRLTYGTVLLDIERLLGTEILITLKPRIFTPKDAKNRITVVQGAILIPIRLTRVPKRVKSPFRYQIYSHGIYEAIRGRTHTILGYGTKGGAGELQEIDAQVETVSDIISILIRYTTLSPEEKCKLSQMLMKVTSELKRKRNEAKKEAREFLDQSVEVRDRLGRSNPSATGARVCAARERLQLRLSEIRRISPRITAFEVALMNEKNRIWRIFDQLVDNLREVEHALRQCNLIETDQTFIRSICERLTSLEREVATIRVQPLVAFSRMVAKELSETRKLVELRQLDLAQKIIEKILRSIRFKRAQQHLEEKVIFPLSMLLEKGGLSETHVQRLRKCLIYFQGRFARLDESGFRYKPKDKVQKLLAEALKALDTQDYQEVKETLKAISNVL